MSKKDELAFAREQQLAKLRGTTVEPERITLEFACALHDRGFRMTFARTSPSHRFRCESVEKDAPRHATAREPLQGLFKPADSLRVRVEELDLPSLPCVVCGFESSWTLCHHCNKLVCGARSTTGHFTCRKSCGGQFRTVPVDALDASHSTGTTPRPAIGRQGQTLLPGKGSRK